MRATLGMPRHTDQSPDIPTLVTLRTPPSWLNRAGRVDRSACFVVGVGALWRRIPASGWRDTARAAHKRRTQTPERVGTTTLTAHDLWVLHRHETPRRVAGDARTTKSNALKAGDAIGGLDQRSVRAQTIAADKTADGVGGFDQPAVNPNRGIGFAMRRKILGLPTDWEATLTIERYRQHARLSQHFLVCPVCGGRTGCESGMTPQRHDRQDTCPTKQKKLPLGRVTKLYLPLATPREWEDAQVAHLWLRTHQPPNRPLSPEASSLIERYTELFPGRRLRCRRCLGLRYGEVK